MKKEKTRNLIKDKIMSLYRKNEKLSLLQSRLDILEALIVHNKKKQAIKVQEIGHENGRNAQNDGF